MGTTQTAVPDQTSLADKAASFLRHTTDERDSTGGTWNVPGEFKTREFWNEHPAALQGHADALNAWAAMDYGPRKAIVCGAVDADVDTLKGNRLLSTGHIAEQAMAAISYYMQPEILEDMVKANEMATRVQLSAAGRPRSNWARVEEHGPMEFRYRNRRFAEESGQGKQPRQID